MQRETPCPFSFETVFFFFPEVPLKSKSNLLLKDRIEQNHHKTTALFFFSFRFHKDGEVMNDEVRVGAGLAFVP